MRDESVIQIRRAESSDVDFATALLAHQEVEPFLSMHRGRNREDVLARIEQSQREPASAGVFVIEVGERRAGLMEFETFSERSRIASLGGLAVDPEFRGHGVAEEAARVLQQHLLLDLGFHRLQLEVYGFNDRSIRHAERVGFVREGAKRKAYRRHGEWHDGVMFGLVREDRARDPEQAAVVPPHQDLEGRVIGPGDATDELDVVERGQGNGAGLRAHGHKPLTKRCPKGL